MWVLLPGLQFVLWNKEALVAIQNHLRCFIHMEEEMLHEVDRRMGRILVEIDMSKGLLDKFFIESHGRTISWSLDYRGIPFVCLKCKEIGHLWKFCTSWFRF